MNEDIIRYCFNPSFAGLVVLTSANSSITLDLSEFQSFFCWISSFNSINTYNRRPMEMSFNPSFVGLVVLTVPLAAETHTNTAFQSFFCWISSFNNISEDNLGDLDLMFQSFFCWISSFNSDVI